MSAAEGKLGRNSVRWKSRTAKVLRDDRSLSSKGDRNGTAAAETRRAATKEKESGRGIGRREEREPTKRKAMQKRKKTKQKKKRKKEGEGVARRAAGAKRSVKSGTFHLAADLWSTREYAKWATAPSARCRRWAPASPGRCSRHVTFHLRLAPMTASTTSPPPPPPPP